MIREESWQVAGITLSLLRQITSLGYTVSVHRIPSSLFGRVPAFTEIHAVDKRKNADVPYVARVAVTEGGDTDYRCACLLAEAVGIDLEG